MPETSTSLPRSRAPRFARHPTRGTVPGILAAVVLPLTLVYLTGALFFVDQAAPRPAGGAASRYVPLDGMSARVQDLGGTVDVIENARMVGIEGILNAPDPVASAVFSLAGENARSAQLWRQTTSHADGSAFNDLYLLDERGISEVAAWGGNLGLLFDPPLPILPATLSPAQSWDVQGNALPGGTLLYQSRGEVVPTPEVVEWRGTPREVQESCVSVRSSLEIRDPGGLTGMADADGVLARSEQTTIWCPEVGGVFSLGTQNGAPIGSAVLQNSVPLAPPEGFIERDAEPAVPPPGTARQLKSVREDPFFRESAAQTRIAVEPAVTGSGAVIVANDRGDELQAYQLGEDKAHEMWSGHPGGVIVSVGTVADVALAGTVNREIVAYDPLGRRLWTWRGPELALGSPIPASAPSSGDCPGARLAAGVRMPECDVLVGTRDGTIVRLDLATGVEQWRTSVQADLRGALVSAGDTVIAADERGGLTALNTRDGSVRWQHDEGLASANAASSEAGGVVASLTHDGVLNAYRLEDGRSLWSTDVPGSLRGLEITREGVILSTDSATSSFDLAEGALRWRRHGSDGFVASGTVAGGTDRLIALDGDTVTAWDLAGEQTGSWRLSDLPAASDHLLFANRGVFGIMDALANFWVMGQG